MRVTAKKLEAKGACGGVVRWFKRRWPEGCETTLKNLVIAAEKDTENLLWFAFDYLNDLELGNRLEDEENSLNANWKETVEKRIVERAERAARCFVRFTRIIEETQDRLRKCKLERKRAQAELRKTIAAKIARIVYDRVKPARATAKKRRPK